ncbi:hypothetical protein L1987_78592 [Smallanthus sonchifolius]|uniref:Uncharacterized protein n=1 Tax=Smallanthus sonchifolius TaxID=185202 RepID=A0ACB8ZCB2_9ASTR|nr:hypothetical protein L1987_78592 [Smallanthus sonchifolius]
MLKHGGRTLDYTSLVLGEIGTANAFPIHLMSLDLQAPLVLHLHAKKYNYSYRRVVIRNRPELWDKPVAVCHSDNPRGTSEISSANYPARDHGVRAGIFVRAAKACCPHLVIVPYDFEAYEEV